MHHLKIGKTTFNFHSDMRGDVIIRVGDDEVRTDANDLVEFVLSGLVRDKISVLENLTGEELRGHFVGGDPRLKKPSE